MNVIETVKLTKSYGKARGIVEVDMQVAEGEIYGFIGPNGAGKSTTIRTLLALLYKDSGEARIFGMDCETQREEILKEVGYLPSEVFYYDSMRAGELLSYSASFYNKDCRERIRTLSDALELDLRQKVEDMSLGNKKKVGIVQGLLHSPKLIILDEPTSGLDPLMQQTFFELIREENKRGATILFSSHILGEVQKMCDRVSIIREGSIISTEKISDLRKNAYKKVQLAYSEDQLLPDSKEIVLPAEATSIEWQPGHVSFLYKGDCNALLRNLTSYDLADVAIVEPSLEEIFMHYYSR